MDTQVPIWMKYTMSIEEAAQYFRIGENKLRKMVRENRDADFVLWNAVSFPLCVSILKLILAIFSLALTGVEQPALVVFPFFVSHISEPLLRRLHGNEVRAEGVNKKQLYVYVFTKASCSATVNACRFGFSQL